MTDELSKKYYGIADVSIMTGVPASTLRFWETEFRQLRPKRNAGRTRFYTPKDIELIELIKFLVKDHGLKIDKARSYINNNRGDLDLRHSVVKRLEQVRKQLVRLRDSLDQRK